VQRETRPREACAARYQSGQPHADLEAVARRAGDFEITEIPQWRLWVPKTVSPYATWAYSWIRPPNRSRHSTRIPVTSACGYARNVAVPGRA